LSGLKEEKIKSLQLQHGLDRENAAKLFEYQSYLGF
jgi:hypothetical protein